MTDNGDQRLEARKVHKSLETMTRHGLRWCRELLGAPLGRHTRSCRRRSSSSQPISLAGIGLGCLASAVGRTGHYRSEIGATSPGGVDLQEGSDEA